MKLDTSRQLSQAASRPERGFNYRGATQMLKPFSLPHAMHQSRGMLDSLSADLYGEKIYANK